MRERVLVRFLIWIFASIGLLTVLIVGGGYGLGRMLNGSNSFSVKESMPSPDGMHVAVRYIGMGGGAAGWCSQVVAITRAGESFTADTEWNHAVYRGTCSVEPELRWLSASRLRISLPSFVTPEWTTASVRGWTESKRVEVQFEFMHQTSLSADAGNFMRL